MLEAGIAKHREERIVVSDKDVKISPAVRERVIVDGSQQAGEALRIFGKEVEQEPALDDLIRRRDMRPFDPTIKKSTWNAQNL